MVMSLRVFYKDLSPSASGENATEPALTVIAGYESGRVCVFSQVAVPRTSQGHGQRSMKSEIGTWQIVYTARSHEQPLLSLDISPSLDVFFTSGADAIISRHPLHSSSPNPSTSDPDVDNNDEQAVNKTPRHFRVVKAKEIKTGHSGQQGLCIRSDGRLFATAGWDGRARVYSVNTMKELAVLKWHKEGCYAAAFAHVGAANRAGTRQEEEKNDDAGASRIGENHEKQLVRSQGSGGMTVRNARTSKAHTTHWLAVGSKDAKISLWDIY